MDMNFEKIEGSRPGMIRADLDRQLMVRTDNDVGKLTELTEILSAAGINLVAVCAYAVGDVAALMFVTDDNNHAKLVLEQKEYKFEEEEVIILTLENKPGTLQHVSKKISDSGIDCRLMYGSVDGASAVSRIVLIAKDNLDAMLVIKTELERS